MVELVDWIHDVAWPRIARTRVARAVTLAGVFVIFGPRTARQQLADFREQDSHRVAWEQQQQRWQAFLEGLANWARSREERRERERSL